MEIAGGRSAVGLDQLAYSEHGAHWVDNLLDWTVRDHADISIDYDLGEVANRSFRDKYGIWAGQEEIFPEARPGGAGAGELIEETPRNCTPQAVGSRSLVTLETIAGEPSPGAIGNCTRARSRGKEDVSEDLSYSITGSSGRVA